MYINEIKLKNFRTFENESITFVHPDQNFKLLGIPEPKLKNINLLLGNNGSGKSALLKAIALLALGPAAKSSGLFIYRLVRRSPRPSKKINNTASLEASFKPHDQDDVPKSVKIIESKLDIVRRGDIEEVEWAHAQQKRWNSVYSGESDAFFVVGYGATRRVERINTIDPASRSSTSFTRAQRIQGLFEDSYSLYPLGSWLPNFKTGNPGRYKQVINLINRLLKNEDFVFEGAMDKKGEFLFKQNGLEVPFPALSDGYKAFLGWVGDLLYHVCQTCPSGKKLAENRGIVMVDEIDLHLHPKWQMSILPTLAEHLPNIQFIVTSHSPLIVGTLEWMNIILMSPLPKEMTTHLLRLADGGSWARCRPDPFD